MIQDDQQIEVALGTSLAARGRSEQRYGDNRTRVDPEYSPHGSLEDRVKAVVPKWRQLALEARFKANDGVRNRIPASSEPEEPATGNQSR